jgi:predicted trehalose synthase
LGAVAAAIVDSRNVFHQAGDAIGVRARPTVPGVRAALGRLGFPVDAVHVGLALARQRDQVDLAAPHAANLAYQQRVLKRMAEMFSSVSSTASRVARSRTKWLIPRAACE